MWSCMFSVNGGRGKATSDPRLESARAKRVCEPCNACVWDGEDVSLCRRSAGADHMPGLAM